MRGLSGVDRCPTDSTDHWVEGMAKQLMLPLSEYVSRLCGRNGAPPSVGFLGTLRLVSDPTKVDTQAHSWGSRYTSIDTQLALQEALAAVGQGLLAVGGEDGDVSELVRKLNSEPLRLITKLQHAVGDSGSFVRSAGRLASMRRSIEGGRQLDEDARLELFDWLRSAVALARRPADGFVGNKAQPPLSLRDAVMSDEQPQLYPALLGRLPDKEQPSRSPTEKEALCVAAEALWQHLHTRIEAELERQQKAEPVTAVVAASPEAGPSRARVAEAESATGTGAASKRQRTAEPVAASAPSPET